MICIKTISLTVKIIIIIIIIIIVIVLFPFCHTNYYLIQTDYFAKAIAFTLSSVSLFENHPFGSKNEIAKKHQKRI